MTERVEEEVELQKEEQILKEQELSNLLHQKDYVKAVVVAISLGQPFRVLNILQGQHSWHVQCIMACNGERTDNILLFHHSQSCWMTEVCRGASKTPSCL